MNANIKRRDFITLLGGAAAAWLLPARAQQVKPTIGILASGSRSTQGNLIATFVQRLHELGWIEGRSVAIEYRWTEGRSERATELAAELVKLKAAVIVTSGTPTVLAVRQVTSEIPIVFASAGDPVGTGLVASLARPGGNITGLANQTQDITGKRIELMKELVPGLRQLAILANSGSRPRARLARHHARSQARRRSRACHRDAQGAQRRALCRDRPADDHQSKSHQQLGARCAPADGPRQSR